MHDIFGILFKIIITLSKEIILYALLNSTILAYMLDDLLAVRIILPYSAMKKKKKENEENKRAKLNNNKITTTNSYK